MKKVFTIFVALIGIFVLTSCSNINTETTLNNEPAVYELNPESDGGNTECGYINIIDKENTGDYKQVLEGWNVGVFQRQGAPKEMTIEVLYRTISILRHGRF